jgi:hypothetical protein
MAAQRREVFVPLTYRPGISRKWTSRGARPRRRERRKVWLFLLRLMYSGGDVAWIYPRQDQVSFLDGQCGRSRTLGACPGVWPTIISGPRWCGSWSAASER